MIIKQVTVKTESRYRDGSCYEREDDFLILELPLPGGKIVYDIPLQSGVRENLEKAAALVEIKNQI